MIQIIEINGTLVTVDPPITTEELIPLLTKSFNGDDVDPNTCLHTGKKKYQNTIVFTDSKNEKI
jgi:hypothetical protein